jgi:hypothetical protein
MSQTSDDAWSLQFAAKKSLRYHAARRAFFDGAHRWTMAIVAIGGSTAFIGIIGEATEWAKWAALVLTIAGALDVAFGFSERARQHNSLYQRWSDLLAEMLRYGPPTESVLREWQAQRALIEKDEPTPLSALNVICHNTEAEVQQLGLENFYHVRWYQSLFRHLLTIPPDYFPPKEEWRKKPVSKFRKIVIFVLILVVGVAVGAFIAWRLF